MAFSANDHTIDELNPVRIARQVSDGGVVAQGIAMSPATAGCLLCSIEWNDSISGSGLSPAHHPGAGLCCFFQNTDPN
jgi:hypothetical protein